MSQNSKIHTLEKEIESLRQKCALYEREAKLFRTFFEQTKDAIFIENETDQIVDANESACRLLGYTREEMRRLTVSDLQAPEVRGLTGSTIKNEIEKHKGSIFEGVDLHQNGTRISVEISNCRLTEMDLVVSIVRDISVRKELEAELRHANIELEQQVAKRTAALAGSEQKYRILFENAKEAIFVAQDEMIKFPNPQALELYDWPEEILTSKPLTYFIHEEDRQIVLDRHKARLRGETPPQVYDFRIITQAGVIRWVELKVAAITWEDKPAALCFMLDISERKAIEHEREKLIADLQKALAKVHTLGGLLPICAHCKKIRDDGGYWNKIESYIEAHSKAEFSHSICPACEKEFYPELLEENEYRS